MSNFFHKLHYLILIFILSIVFWPLKYLKYGIFVPWILNFIWLIFGNCPITLMHSKKNNENNENNKNERQPSFFHDILLKINPNISRGYSNIILYFIMMSITMISYLRLKYIQ